MRTLPNSLAVTRRRALVALLIVAAGFAPVVSAVCDLAVPAAHAGAGGLAPAQNDDDARCAHELDAFVVQARLPAADGALAVSPGAVPVLVTGCALGLRTASADPVIREHASAPPEPVFRRVPRLLL
jgi:hypothetical protein